MIESMLGENKNFRFLVRILLKVYRCGKRYIFLFGFFFFFLLFSIVKTKQLLTIVDIFISVLS